MSAVAAAVLTVPMPRLSDSMEEGTIASWLVADGAAVTRGQEIVEVETDKATMPYEAEVDGVLHVLVAAGETVAVGEPIARIAPAGVEIAQPAPAPTPATRRVSASPLARRIAAELNIDLAALVGSGPHGRVVKRDVLTAQPAPAPQPTLAPEPQPEPTPAPAANLHPLSRVQKLIAERMTASKQSAPDFVLDAEIDMGPAIAMRARLKELLGDAKPPSLGDFVIKACGLALREHPRVNGAYRGDAVELFEHVNVGVAVATDEALVVPTVRDADARSLGQISADVRRLAQAARSGG